MSLDKKVFTASCEVRGPCSHAVTQKEKKKKNPVIVVAVE